MLVDATQVDERLRKLLPDVLIRVETKSGDARFTFVLAEHKSRPARLVALQILKYMTAIYDWLARLDEYKDKLLPRILPIVVYHGPERWNAPLSFDQLVAGHEDPRLKQSLVKQRRCSRMGTTRCERCRCMRVRRRASRMLPELRPLDFDIRLVNLGDMDDVPMSSDPELRLGLLGLKHVRRGKRAEAAIPLIAEALVDAPCLREHALALLTLFECDMDYVVEEVRKALGPKEAINMMTVGQQMMQRGEARGEVKGKADTLLRQLTKRFGTIAEPTKSRLCAATSEQLDRGVDAVLEARRLQDVLDAVGVS